MKFIFGWRKSLQTAGMVHFREDDVLDVTKLFKVQWKEGVQIPGQISELPDDFYPKLSTIIADLKEQASKQPEKYQEYDRAKHLAETS